jgi:hypothetical protein
MSVCERERERESECGGLAYIQTVNFLFFFWSSDLECRTGGVSRHTPPLLAPVVLLPCFYE